MTVYDCVKKRADELGKPIYLVESEAGIANATIRGWKESRPYAETLSKVARVLDCTVEDLLPDEKII